MGCWARFLSAVGFIAAGGYLRRSAVGNTGAVDLRHVVEYDSDDDERRRRKRKKRMNENAMAAYPASSNAYEMCYLPCESVWVRVCATILPDAGRRCM